MTNPKVKLAFNAMEALGIDRGTVKPVLKKLLKVFDKNWEFIEAENYRLLADAIFEDKKDEEVEVKRKKLVDSDSHERPSKKVHLDQDEDDASSIVAEASTTDVSKEGDVPPGVLSSERAETSYFNLKSTRDDPGAYSNFDKGKGPFSSASNSTSDKLACGKASSSSCSELPVDGCVSIQVGKCKAVVCENSRHLSRMKSLAPNKVANSKVPKDVVEGSSTGNASAKSSQWLEPDNMRECGSACNVERCERKFDIASYPSGAVKVCLISLLGQVNSHVPDINAVIKSVEEKFFRSHKFLGHPLSLAMLLEELCKGYFEMTTEITDQSLIKTPSSEFISEENLCRKNSPEESVAIKNNEYSNGKISDAEASNALEDVEKRRPGLYIDDITKGEEKVKISLVDDDEKRIPPKFFYIPRNLIYQKAIINVSLARVSDEDCCPSCPGNCLLAPVPCACARITNGEFAYTQQGLLKEEFLRDVLSGGNDFYCNDCPIERAKNKSKAEKCKGHTVRRFIKECWSKCGCSMECGNRIVQRGITRKLQIFWSDGGKGWGLRTMEDLPKGTFVCEYVGEVVTNTELDERNKQSWGSERHTYPIVLDADWNSENVLNDDFALCLDATQYGNVGRFVNHRCSDANVIEIPVEIETVDHHYYHVAFFTTREVAAFEELSWDYGIDFGDKSHPIKAFRCCCGSPFCRDKIRKRSRVKSRG